MSEDIYRAAVTAMVSAREKMNLPAARAFLDCAKTDRKSCELLLEKGVYPHAVYHLQQSVEKTLKSYLFSIGAITMSELKTMGHSTPEGFVKLLQNPIFSPFFEQIEQTAAGKVENSPEKITELRVSIQQNPSFAFISAEQIKQFLGQKEKIEALMKTLDPMLNNPTIASESAEQLRTKLGIAELKAPKPYEISRKRGFALVPLFYLALITFSHEQTTRYPIPDKIQPAQYVPELGLVSSMPVLLKELDEVLSSFTEMYNE